jgi:pimeloyl-ACP methyl ester carboxylesterase
MVAELHELLFRAGVPPPFVLVGHSMAGFNVRFFARAYPAEVAGLVLVDSSHEDLRSRWQASRSQAEWTEWSRFVKRESTFRDAAPAGAVAEWDSFYQNAASMQGIPLPLGLPIVILTGTRLEDDWQALGITASDVDVKLELHRAWLAEAPQAVHRIAGGSGHYIQKDQPEIVTRAIYEVLAAIGTAP